MDIDDRITRVKNLIQKREEIDTELANLIGITIKAKKVLRCSKCGEEGHNAKTCPSEQLHKERATKGRPFSYRRLVVFFSYASLIDSASYPTRCQGSVRTCGVGAGAF